MYVPTLIAGVTLVASVLAKAPYDPLSWWCADTDGGPSFKETVPADGRCREIANSNAYGDTGSSINVSDEGSGSMVLTDADLVPQHGG